MDRIRVLAMLESTSLSGTAKAVLEFAKEAALGHPDLPKIDLSILTFNRGQGENILTKTIREMGTPHDVITEEGPFDRKIISQLRAAVAHRRPEIIWSNSVKSHFLVRYASLNQSSRWLAFHHGYTSTDTKMRLYNQFDRWSLQKADQVLSSSAAFVEEIVRRKVQRKHISVQHMPIRPATPVSPMQKAELRHRLGLTDNSRVLLCVGRLSREKGQTDLINAFPKILDRAGDMGLRMVLVGEGPERSRIEALCRNLKLANFVKLVGQQDDINPYYGIADIFMLPSLSEGCPNVLLEAMAAGVPVVATAVGGVPELVTNGREALLIKKHDAAAMAFATAELLGDQRLCDRLVSNAREVVLKKSPKVYFRSVTAIFSRMRVGWQ